MAKATIAAVAAEAGVAPGLVHHHFASKQDLLLSLLDDLQARFQRRRAILEADTDPLAAYVDAALSLSGAPDVTAARCWVGLFAAGIRDRELFVRLRRLIDRETAAIVSRSKHRLSSEDASAILAFILGSLVVGAFAPRRARGFAAPAAHRLIAALSAKGAG